MKRKLNISPSIVVIIVVILWWQQYKHDKVFMHSLQLHQLIEINHVDAIHLWEKELI